MAELDPEKHANNGSTAGWEAVDHTADIGLRVWAPTLESLFEHAAEGVTSLSVDISRVHPVEDHQIEADGLDREELLISWLQECLYLWSGSAFMGRQFHVRILPPNRQDPEEIWRLEGTVTGEVWDSERHEAFTDIKAATYHNLEIRSGTDAAGKAIYRVELILDT